MRVRRTAVMVGALALAFVAAGCSGEGDSPIVEAAHPDETPDSTDATETSDPATPTTTSEGDAGAELDPKELIGLARPSIALVTTPVSQGSGVLVADGYVVTNAHVVDPYGTASVTFEGDDTVEEVPVVGVDPFADLALLGPLDVDREPLPVATGADLEQGDPVYLIGYPGEFDTAPEVTISSGLVSRMRQYEAFDQTYIQTDAAIGGGQSGGALVDAAGRVVGISGLSFAEEFALAVSGKDTLRSIEAIRAGTTPAYRPFVDAPALTSGTVEVRDDFETRVLLLGAAAEDRTLRLTIAEDTEAMVEVADLVGGLYYVNQHLIDEVVAADPTLQPSDIGDLLPAAAPGVYELDIPADTDVTIALSTTKAGGASVGFESSLPLVVYDDTDDGGVIAAGESVDGVIDAFEQRDSYLLELAAGETVTIRVSAGAGDALFVVVPRGTSALEAVPVDDSNIGLAGYDAEDTFTAEAAGTYELIVGVNEPFVTGYRLDVEPA